MSTKKMWGGRFAQGQDALVEAYTESVSFDRLLYRQDIAGSSAHARMLARQGILSGEEAETLCRGLQAILEEIEQDRFVWKPELEDVHMNIESRLTELVGDVGKKLHTGRSRNDQVALDFRLFVSDSVRNWSALLAALVRTLADRAQEHADTLMPGYTHLQPAQPVSLAQHLLAYAAMFRRDASRLADADRRIRICPLGAAALAGTTYPVDPHFVAGELDMYGVFSNSMDAVSDRDFVLESMFCASLVLLHLSRLCEDMVLWANPSFGYVRLPDAYATGSSIMPQKKNPDVAELMRGKSGRVYGALFGLMVTLKGLPMTYNRDLQEDKEPFFDLNDTVQMSLRLMSGMLSEIRFVPERMRAALDRGFLNATELADYLVGKKVPFREAHHLTGQAVAEAEARGIALEALSLEQLREICPLIEADVFSILDYEEAVRRRDSPGGTGPNSIRAQLAKLREWLGQGE
ncbi:argininosuccinate lyase [Desulfovibrio sp. OttesenSCG-928-A18]|nr:argininosuccinate lyase [Desulfovibrio sp. OttesenSCG-928-A18]